MKQSGAFQWSKRSPTSKRGDCVFEVGGVIQVLALLLLLPMVGSADLNAQELIAPRSAPLDAPLEIRVNGASPGSSVVLRMTSSDAQGRVWSSEAEFVASATGRVSLTTDAPVEGSYSGVDPMGLIATMELGNVEHSRFALSSSGDATLHLVLVIDDMVVDSLSIERNVMPSGVRQEPVEPSLGVVGTLFLPATQPALGGILVLGGSEGGNSGAGLAAQLAGHGFAALSVAYFGAPGLPAELRRIPLEYFSTAIGLLQSRPGMSDAPIGILGTSKGAEAALLVASRDPRVNTVVAYAPSSVAWSCICQAAEESSWTLEGEAVPAVGPGSDPDHVSAPGEPITPTVHYRYRKRNWPDLEAARIPVDNISGPIMIVAGGADALWPSGEMAREIRSRRAGIAESAGDVYLNYHGAGHLIGKAYLPAGSTRIARGRIETGGSPRANSLAQADAWPQVLGFLERVFANDDLVPDGPLPNKHLEQSQAF